MIPALCTLLLLAVAGVLLARAGGRTAQAARVVAGIDSDAATRAADVLDAARDHVATAIRDHRAGRDRPSAADR